MSRLILVGLADHTNAKGLVYVSARTLAAELDISPNTVFIAYRLFEREGILLRTGRRMGPGGTIEYRMVVEHLEPKNSRFVPLSESRNSSPRAVRQQSNHRTGTEHLTDETSDETSYLVTITDTATPSDTPSDAAISERSRSRSSSGDINVNQNTNRNDDSRAADIEVLFDDALNLELEFRPSEIPRDALRARKRRTYLSAAEKVLNTYPMARPSIQSDRDLALAVCEMMNPGDYRFKIGTTTRKVMADRYQDDPTDFFAEYVNAQSSTEIEF